ncbi:MAG: hypothetical protein ACRCW9_05450 [Cetobacterium sp.]
MKKKILFFLIISTISFSATNINSETLFNGDLEVGELYSCSFETENERNQKISREKKYMMEKDDFKYYFDKNQKDGIAYIASYNTPFGYTISFKAFCGNEYISINGGYEKFDELLALFLEKTKNLGYDF